jgi:hydrogenase maturation factor
MIGEVRKDRLVQTSGAKEGDLILLAKGVCIEGTSIIARERGKELLKRGIPSSLIKKAKSFIFAPGIDVLRASQIACKTVLVHSMHDPTEGGVVNAIIEMAMASQKEFVIDLDKIFIYKESQILCREFGLNPLKVISSGALLLAISPKDLSPLQNAFKKASIPLSLIGYVRKGPSRVLAKDGNTYRELKPISSDEILKIYDK